MLKRKGILAILFLVGLFIVLHREFAPEHHSPRTTMLGGIAFLLATTSIFLPPASARWKTGSAGWTGCIRCTKPTAFFTRLFVLVQFFGVPKELPAGVDAGVDAVANPMLPSAPLGMIALVLLMISLGLSLNRKIAYHK